MFAWFLLFSGRALLAELGKLVFYLRDPVQLLLLESEINAVIDLFEKDSNLTHSSALFFHLYGSVFLYIYIYNRDSFAFQLTEYFIFLFSFYFILISLLQHRQMWYRPKPILVKGVVDDVDLFEVGQGFVREVSLGSMQAMISSFIEKAAQVRTCRSWYRTGLTVDCPRCDDRRSEYCRRLASCRRRSGRGTPPGWPGSAEGSCRTYGAPCTRSGPPRIFP